MESLINVGEVFEVDCNKLSWFVFVTNFMKILQENWIAAFH